MRVFILEDCEIFRLSLSLVLTQESAIEIVGSMNSNPHDICNRILSSNCEVLLVGLRLRNRSGLEIARKIKEMNPNIPIIALGFFTDIANIVEMKRGGISIFVPMQSTNDYITNKVLNAKESLNKNDFSGVTSSPRISIVPGKQ